MMLNTICRPFVLTLALCLSGPVMFCGTPSGAAEPRAIMSGPSVASVGEDFFLRFRGTISDSPIVFKQAKGPVASDAMLLSSPGGQVACAVVNANQPGTYSFALLARGKSTPTSDELLDFAILTVQVGPPGPTPNPDPNPPGPTPNPTDPVEAIGAAYAPVMAISHAHAWDAFADSLQAGKSMVDSRKDYQAKWQGEMTAWVSANLAPVMSTLISEGKEPDANQRVSLISFARKMAIGLKSRAVR